jgi:hypothetical protein
MLGSVIPDSKAHPSKKLAAIDRSAQWSWRDNANTAGQSYPVKQIEIEQKDFLQNQGSMHSAWSTVTVAERDSDPDKGGYRVEDFDYSFIMPVWWEPNATPITAFVVTQHYQWVHALTVWRQIAGPIPDSQLNHLAIFEWPYPAPYFKVVQQTSTGAINVMGWGNFFVPWDPGSGGAFNPPVPGGTVTLTQTAEGPETKKWTGIEAWPDPPITDEQKGNYEQTMLAAPDPTRKYELKKWAKVVYQLWNGRVRFSKAPERKNQVWVEPDVDDSEPHAQAKRAKIFMLDPESDEKNKGGGELIYVPAVRDQDFTQEFDRKGKPIPAFPPNARNDKDNFPGAEDKSPDDKK